jgi:hypothetical protein
MCKRIALALGVLSVLGCSDDHESFESQTLPLARASSWTRDQGRLNRAFIQLDREGILARQELGDGAGSSQRLLVDEIDLARAQGRNLEGYVYTWGDGILDSEQGEPLLVGYGAIDESPDGPGPRAIRIGRRVLAALRERRLDAHWSGDPDEYIEVRAIDLRSADYYYE